MKLHFMKGKGGRSALQVAVSGWENKWAQKVIRRFYGKNIYNLSENRGMVCGLSTEATILFSPYLCSSDFCHGNCQLL